MSLVWQDPESRAKSKPEMSLPLFEQAHARNSDPKHSHEAAASVTNLGPTRDLILLILKTCGPQTDESLIEYFHNTARNDRDWDALRHTSVSGIRSRRSELVRMGFVVEAGDGVTASGRKCSIWRLR